MEISLKKQYEDDIVIEFEECVLLSENELPDNEQNCVICVIQGAYNKHM